MPDVDLIAEFYLVDRGLRHLFIFPMVSRNGCFPLKYIIKTVIWSCVKSIPSVDIRWALSKGHRFDYNVSAR